MSEDPREEEGGDEAGVPATLGPEGAPSGESASPPSAPPSAPAFEPEPEPGEDAAEAPGPLPDEDASEASGMLVPRANPPRARGLVPLALGSALTLTLMASPSQLRFGVPLGALGVLLATFGVLDLFGTFDDARSRPEARVVARVGVRALAEPLLVVLCAGALLASFVTLAVAGRMPVLASAFLVPAAFLGLVFGVFQAAERLGATREQDGAPGPPIHRRQGAWLVALATLLYLPMLGSHGLTDPWETHYGEVAREILARDDWISLWWAQDGWFWSKPVLSFWLQALAMSAFGVRYRPGEMVAAVAEGRAPWPEWAVRLPIFLLTITALYLLYKAGSRVFGRRAGFLGAAALATMPQWFFVSHQTMTDMPFVASMSAAMALFVLGVHEDPQKEVCVYEVSAGKLSFGLSRVHVVLGAVLACALPQIFYLLSRNFTLDFGRLRLGIHGDSFLSGSGGGNCGLPGNEACRQFVPLSPSLQPSLQALLWLAALAGVLVLSSGERRSQRLYFLAAWFFAALGTASKGIAGFGLPVLVALVYVVVTRRYRTLLRMEIAAGALVLASLVLPWFVAMYARHGGAFTDRLLFHDMFKRAFEHVHDTNEGDDTSFRYYVWQLGYATFPFSGLVPVALVAWLRRGEETRDARTDGSIFFALWFALAFALFSLMPTKFHHYILPALPPTAMLTGVLLDDLGRRAASFEAAYERAALGLAALGAALHVALVGRDFFGPLEPNQARLLHLFTYQYKRPWPPSLDFEATLFGFTIAAALATAALSLPRARRAGPLALLAVSSAFTAFGLDVYFVKTSPHWGQRETIMAYYEEAERLPGPLIAYQMNWKGENFYTGNRIPAFVSSGKKFQEYVAELRQRGQKVFYFVTEPARVPSLSTELRSPLALDRLTTPELNNKFVLVRVAFE